MRVSFSRELPVFSGSVEAEAGGVMQTQRPSASGISSFGAVH